MKENLIMIPFLVLGGMVAGVIVFLETYRHFPRMDKEKLLKLSIINAVIMALIIITINYLIIILIINKVLR